MRVSLEKSSIQSSALAGVRRAAGELHSHEQELSKRPELAAGAELARSAASAADTLSRLLERADASSDHDA